MIIRCTLLALAMQAAISTTASSVSQNSQSLPLFGGDMLVSQEQILEAFGAELAAEAPKLFTLRPPDALEREQINQRALVEKMHRKNEGDRRLGAPYYTSGRLWKYGRVFYHFDENMSAEQLVVLRTNLPLVATKLKSQANLTLIEQYIPGVSVQINEGSGCSSSIGAVNSPYMSLGGGCAEVSIAAHEFLHLLNMFHEHTNSERNNFVTINFENITPGREHNFALQQSSHNLDVKYDFESIMHYRAYTFTARDDSGEYVGPSIEIKDPVLNAKYQDLIGNFDEISKRDAVQLQLMYHCTLQDTFTGDVTANNGVSQLARKMSELCDTTCPCFNGQGHCNTDEDCHGDLICVKNYNTYSHLGQTLTLDDLTIDSLNVCLPGGTTGSPTPPKQPSKNPTKAPTTSPTLKPSSAMPSVSPISQPSLVPSMMPITLSPTAIDSDPFCLVGIKQNSTCCSLECGDSCWTEDACSVDSAAKSCCPTSNRAYFSARSCNDFSAPCQIDTTISSRKPKEDDGGLFGLGLDDVTLGVGGGLLGVACCAIVGVLYVHDKRKKTLPHTRIKSRKFVKGKKTPGRLEDTGSSVSFFGSFGRMAALSSFGGSDASDVEDGRGVQFQPTKKKKTLKQTKKNGKFEKKQATNKKKKKTSPWSPNKMKPVIDLPEEESDNPKPNSRFDARKPTGNPKKPRKPSHMSSPRSNSGPKYNAFTAPPPPASRPKLSSPATSTPYFSNSNPQLGSATPQSGNSQPRFGNAPGWGSRSDQQDPPVTSVAESFGNVMAAWGLSSDTSANSSPNRSPVPTFVKANSPRTSPTFGRKMLRRGSSFKAGASKPRPNRFSPGPVTVSGNPTFNKNNNNSSPFSTPPAWARKNSNNRDNNSNNNSTLSPFSTAGRADNNNQSTSAPRFQGNTASPSSAWSSNNNNRNNFSNNNHSTPASRFQGNATSPSTSGHRRFDGSGSGSGSGGGSGVDTQPLSTVQQRLADIERQTNQQAVAGRQVAARGSQGSSPFNVQLRPTGRNLN